MRRPPDDVSAESTQNELPEQQIDDKRGAQESAAAESDEPGASAPGEASKRHFGYASHDCEVTFGGMLSLPLGTDTIDVTEDLAERDRLIAEGDIAYEEYRFRDAICAWARAGDRERLRRFADEKFRIRAHHEQVRDVYVLLDDLGKLARLLPFYSDGVMQHFANEVRRYLRERGFNIRETW